MNCYADAANATAMLLLLLHIEICYNCYDERVIDISRTCRHCYAETAETATLTSFAAVATAIAYADASVARVALLTVFKVICCCYRNCYDDNC